MTGSPRTGAEVLVEALVAHGVTRIFTVSGNHVLAIFDATIDRGVGLLHVRHEATAVHMADAWGRLTDRPGVALVTGGPGHLNALSALYGALMAESPVLLLSGHAPRDEIGRGGFQEVDQVGTARPVAKAAWLVDDPARVGTDVARALALTTGGRPGPVHLSLPTDVLEAHVGDVGGPRGTPFEPDFVGPGRLDPLGLDEVGQHLARAVRPLIVVGPAMGRGARWQAVRRLGEAARVPVIVGESPRGVNDPWLRQATRCLAEADLVLLLGKALDFSLRFGAPPAFAPDCRFVRIDVDAGSAAGDGRVGLALAGDPALAAEALTRQAVRRAGRDGAWQAAVLDARAREPAEWAALGAGSARPIHPLRVCQSLKPYLAAGGVLVSDGGEFGQWIQAGLEAEHRLINGLSGSIGSAIPMALAAKLVHRAEPVFVTQGDGAFGYAGLELDTALRYDLPVVAIVGNDARWNAEYQLQVRRYGVDRAVGCDLWPSRYDRVVEALGGHGEYVEEPDQLDRALSRAIRSGRPACVNVTIASVAAPTFPALSS